MKITITNDMRAALAANLSIQRFLAWQLRNETFAQRIDRVWKLFGATRGLKKTLIEESRNKRFISTKSAKSNAALHARLWARWNSNLSIAESLQRAIERRYIRASQFAGNTYHRDEGDMRYCKEYDPKRNAALIRADGWCQYSRNYGHTINMAGLVIRDPDTKQLVFLRVPPNTQTIDEALNALKPAIVKKAEQEGKRVIRQGDFYLIPQKKWNLTALQGTRHTVRENGKIEIEHPQHGTLILSKPHKAIRQIQVKNTGVGTRATGYRD